MATWIERSMGVWASHNIYIMPDFNQEFKTSLTQCKIPTFPWSWKLFCYSWFSLTMATLHNGGFYIVKIYWKKYLSNQSLQFWNSLVNWCKDKLLRPIFYQVESLQWKYFLVPLYIWIVNTHGSFLWKQRKFVLSFKTLTKHDQKIKVNYIFVVLGNHGVLSSKRNRRLPHLHNNIHLHNSISLCNYFYIYSLHGQSWKGETR